LRNVLKIIFSHCTNHLCGVYIFILSQNLVSGVSSEEAETREHVEKEASQAKDINFRRSLPLSKYLRCYIARCAAPSSQFYFIAEPASHA
jgi:hypothetical protein